MAQKRIASNISQKYLDGLHARNFLAECTNDIYHDALSDKELDLLQAYAECWYNFEAWKKAKREYK